MMQLCVGADNSTTIGKWFDESSKISHIWMQKHDLFAKVAERPIKKPTMLLASDMATSSDCTTPVKIQC